MKLIRNGQEIISRSPETPCKALEGTKQDNTATDTSTAKKGFISRTGRNYNAMYRAAVDLHKSFYPPVQGDEEAVLDYWQRVADAMLDSSRAFNDDPFAMALLAAVFEELEREQLSSVNEA